MSNNKPIPPMSKGVKALYDAFIVAFDTTAHRYRLTPAEIVIALAAVCSMIINHAALATRSDPEKLLEVFRSSLKIPPRKEGGNRANG